MLMQSVRPTIKHFQSHGKKSDDVGETKTYKDTQPFIKFLRTTFFFFSNKEMERSYGDGLVLV